jgi:hypothetical protein
MLVAEVMVSQFAFIIHPVSGARDAARKYTGERA